MNGESKYVAGVLGKPVSVNRMYGRKARGGFYLTDAAASWQSDILYAVRTQMDTYALACAWKSAGFPQIAIALTFYGVRGDLDNYAKCALDGLKKAIGIDDRFFSPVSLHLGERKHQRPGARIEITIPAVAETLPPEDDPDGDPDDDLPPAATQPQSQPQAEENGWSVADLLDPTAPDAPALVKPVQRVTVLHEPNYDSIVVLFPASLRAATAEWATFLPLDQARELRDRLVELKALDEAPHDEWRQAWAGVAWPAGRAGRAGHGAGQGGGR